MAAEHFQAVFVDTASSPASVLRVKIPGFDNGVGTFVVTWSPLGNALPAAGDHALVVESDDGTWWAVSWWSAALALVDAVGLDARLDTLEAGPEATLYIGAAGQPAFQNSWANNDAGTPGVTAGMRAAAFYKHMGRVYLSGAIKTGASGSVAFTLPAGYRPAANSDFLVEAGGIATVGMVQVQSGGSVVPFSGTGNVATFCFLDAVNFRHT